ncbi:amphi-Trp domain-containing protein [Desulfovibrio sulfodismutans]|uniref:Amphi-Trp domain-containing protein n=1 Tax=Desulfolutivibrio sulfodismutans TaxID=63561 RepID=A0A7K3NHI0_9BACT|nr:amphi-Trp domain-containing protein [Desulfolutivibrio sulfodismutans]NDY55642.1 amphi-Trp domain-containing protein [Desulfolutivibrio sulfodismutans]
MSEKNVLFESEGKALTYDAGVLLRRIADGLCKGQIELDGESEAVCIPLANDVSMEIKIKDKAKGEACKRVLEIEMKWLVPKPE